MSSKNARPSKTPVERLLNQTVNLRYLAQMDGAESVAVVHREVRHLAEILAQGAGVGGRAAPRCAEIAAAGAMLAVHMLHSQMLAGEGDGEFRRQLAEMGASHDGNMPLVPIIVMTAFVSMGLAFDRRTLAEIDAEPTVAVRAAWGEASHGLCNGRAVAIGAMPETRAPEGQLESYKFSPYADVEGMCKRLLEAACYGGYVTMADIESCNDPNVLSARAMSEFADGLLTRRDAVAGLDADAVIALKESCDGLLAINAGLEAELAEADAKMASLAQDVADAVAAKESAEASFDAMRKREAELESKLESTPAVRIEVPAEPAPDTNLMRVLTDPSLVAPARATSCVELCRACFGDGIAFSGKAVADLDGFKGRVSELWEALCAIGNIYLPACLSGNPMRIVDFQAASGFETSAKESERTSSDRRLRRLRTAKVFGEEVYTEQHLKGRALRGDNVLRVYFEYLPERRCVAIIRCGGHLDNASTRNRGL